MPNEQAPKGVLYVVATPIGNLKDITLRALEILQAVDCILAEDTRHSQKLLTHYHIVTKLHALHEHNEKSKASWVLKTLQQDKNIALISDAGTPLIHDPGFYLVRLLREQGISVIPIPGASALTTALSVSGLPTDAFVFEGFLPSKRQARQTKLQELVSESRTLVFYESCHRILDCLLDMIDIFGANRAAVLARELTKTYESILSQNLALLRNQLELHPEMQKGEFVVLVSGNAEKSIQLYSEAEKILAVLLESLPVKLAVTLTSKITKQPKNLLYDFAIQKVKHPCQATKQGAQSISVLKTGCSRICRKNKFKKTDAQCQA